MNWRTINIDAYDPDSPCNFDVRDLVPAQAPVSSAEVQQLASQVRQLLRGGDSEGALRGALENAPFGGDKAAKDLHLATLIEVLQSIKQVEMSSMLKRIQDSPDGSQVLDTLMKYLYRGMAYNTHSSTNSNSNANANANTNNAANASSLLSPPSSTSASVKSISPQSTGFSQIQSRATAEGGGQTMSVLLSWHEKVVEVAGVGSIMRVMTDRRTV